MSKITFKNCPFCGSDDIRMLPQKYGYSVDCQTCGAMKHSVSTSQTQAQIAWNNRPGNKIIVKLEEIDFHLTTSPFNEPDIENVLAARNNIRELIEEIKSQ